MTELVLSICIPTYNRARYLKCLLESLEQQAKALKCSYEIVIADNASTDNTEAVVAEFTGKLPIRYIKRDKNYGPADNRTLLFSQSAGELQCYVADDDDLILSEVNAVVKMMLADPFIGVVYAPWRLYDRITKKSGGNFYSHAHDVTLEQGSYEEMLALILDHHIFPEICLIRSDAVRTAMPFSHPLAYWAFVQPTEFLTLGKVVFRKDPFYVSITRYFEDDDRQQFGYEELQNGWDLYRGGVEYLLSRIPPGALSPEKRRLYLDKLQSFIAFRLSVALKFRILGNRDPLDTYYLACRMKAMGYPDRIPMPFDQVCALAAAQFVATGHAASDPIGKIVCVGNLPPLLVHAIKMRAGSMPVIIIPQFNPAQYTNATVVIPGNIHDAGLDHAQLTANHIRLIAADDLMRKFS